MTTTIHNILEEFRQGATSNRDLGDKFERLIANYLMIDPLYREKYSDVWLWDEWHDRGNPNYWSDDYSESCQTHNRVSLETMKIVNALPALNEIAVKGSSTLNELMVNNSPNLNETVV